MGKWANKVPRNSWRSANDFYLKKDFCAEAKIVFIDHD